MKIFEDLRPIIFLSFKFQPINKITKSQIASTHPNHFRPFEISAVSTKSKENKGEKIE
ncbi:hypothetical protein D1AOALGA4SA_3059 [Olavius algarvensis Delta 1 endosymbiont]|nr:hypothetical protein D1AOALGA4SA_3059 [Olavius algarvensis Delta 1 endosymbiont]